MRSFYIYLFCLFFSVGYSQTQIDGKITEFFRIYELNTSESIDYLFKDNRWMEEQFEELLNLKYQLYETQKLLGEFYGFEKISERKLGESLKQVICMVKYDRQPLRFKINFYKPKEEWIVLNFYYDDNFSEEFLDAPTHIVNE